MELQKYEMVMGLEVHAELSTKSKIFCGCSTAFGGEPNTHVCPVCAGMPGALPTLNRAVVEYAIKAGLALNCEITKNCKFDRKNYFYPDLPKAYQISQLYEPICREGHMEIEVCGKKKIIRIREIHMEEDAGKLLHDARGDDTLMDFNRCGVPLIEIVTHPDFRGAGEVNAYLVKLREILLYLGVCDCKMQEGSMRVDVNFSLRPFGGELGTRTETKNLNSFKAIDRAILFEHERQAEILNNGGFITQETRRWDDEIYESYGMRQKENAQDYRYFPEPDLLPIHIGDGWLSQIKASLPEMAHQKRERYMRDYNIPEAQTAVLTGHKNISDLFEAVTDISGNPSEAANLVSGEIMRLMNITNTLPEELSADANKLSAALAFLAEGKINRNAYKETVEAIFIKNADPKAYITENGLLISSDNNAVSDAVNAVLSENQSAVSDYKNGKEKAFGFLMGQAMKKLGKAGNPDAVKKTLIETLEKS